MTRWVIERSYLVDIPSRGYQADSLEHLKLQIQVTADNKKLRKDRPPIGCLEFRWELDENEEATIAHVYFVDSNNVRKRFMRLRRG